jgi:DamX protein
MDMQSEKIADYLALYELSAEPFSALGAESLSRGGFYAGAQRQQVVDQLLHLSQFSSGVLLVLAESGCGKTSLKIACEEQLADDRIVCSVEAGVLDDQQVVFSQIAESLELPFQSSAGQQLASIRSHCQDDEAADLLVLVDNADCLDDPILSGLLSLLQGVDQARSGLHLVLFGSPELARRVDGFQMLDVAVHDLSLPALTCDELGDYLECRLRSAGLAGDLPFSLKDIERFWQLSLGLPGAVNRLALQFMMDRAGELDLGRERRMGLPLGHMAAVVVLGALLIMAVVYRYGGEQGASEQPSIEVVSLVEPSSPRSTSLVETIDEAIDEAQGGANSEVNQVESISGGQVPVEPAVEVRESAYTSEPDFEEPESDQGEASIAAVQSEEIDFPFEAPALGVPFEPSEVLPGFEAEEDMESQMRQEIAMEAEVAPPPSSVSAVKDLGERVTSSAAGSQSAFQSLLPQESASIDERFLLEQQEDNYVLQVLAAGSRQAVDAFVARQSNRAELKVFATQRQGKPWYVVVVGVYSSKADARRAIERLPTEQQKAGPWPRSLLSVHAEIDEVSDI